MHTYIYTYPRSIRNRFDLLLFSINFGSLVAMVSLCAWIVCMCVYIYIYIYIYIHMYVNCVKMRMCVRSPAIWYQLQEPRSHGQYTCMYSVCVYIYIYIYISNREPLSHCSTMHICIYAQAHTHTHTYTHTHTHTEKGDLTLSSNRASSATSSMHTCTSTYIHMYTNTHTHT